VVTVTKNELQGLVMLLFNIEFWLWRYVLYMLYPW